MQESEKLNQDQIELHLKSAVEALTPNVFDRLDLSTPQEAPVSWDTESQKRLIAWNRRVRRISLAAAACLCVLVMGGGTLHYQIQNRRIDSVIGIDVNPSVELSVNRKNRVLAAEALNDDAQVLIEDMDLEGVDLNVAVHAVIGSMVTHGYLDDLDNAILVTVSNDSVKKANALRSSVVSDIEKTLEENQVQAVVYDQQVIEDDEISTLASEYGISYGKAYFIKELIDENDELTMEDMGELSKLTMEEIAQRIADSSYDLGERAGQALEPETSAEAASESSETNEPETEPESTTEPQSEPETAQSASTSQSPAVVSAPANQESESQDLAVRDGLVEIDFADYEDGQVYVYFVTRVKWKHPTVSVWDQEGNSYAAMVAETSGSDCVIEVSGLESGREYTFVLGGLAPVETDRPTTVQGYFEKPEIAGEAKPEESTEKESAGEEESTRDESTGDETAGDESSGGESTGDESTGDESAGGESSGDGGAGNESAGDESSGDESAGGESSGDGNAGNESAGDESGRDGSAGDENTGDESTGNERIGDGSAGGED